MTKNRINDLLLIAKKIGKKIAYFQGGGGNISVKIDDTRMAIKASGYRLQDMTLEQGYSVVDYQRIRLFLCQPKSDEDTFMQKINSFVIATNNRPSMESGFHACLARYVIHTHSIYANLLTCAKEGKQIAQQLFGNMIWIDYVTPGQDLTFAIKRSAVGDRSIFFLQNHGLVISNDSLEDTLDLHESVNQQIRDFFELPAKISLTRKPVFDLEFIKENILFPDQVIYLMADKTGTKAAEETLFAYNFLLATMAKKKLVANFISPAEKKKLLNMESEKYRQKIIDK